MSQKLTRKRVTLAVAALAALAIAAVAIAYWTTSGSGAGAATAGTDQGVTVTGDPANGVYPGGNVAVTTNIDNDSATQPQFVTNLHVTISIDSTHATAGCQASWFTYKSDAEGSGASNPHTTAVNTEIAADGDHDIAGKVFMSDPNVNQDACKGATINLAYSVDNNA